MEKKGKGVAWPESDSDFSDLSIHSSELSDLDSDVHSLSSLMSCANSWIEDAKYPTPAESTLKCLTFAAGVGEPQGRTIIRGCLALARTCCCTVDPPGACPHPSHDDAARASADRHVALRLR